MASRSDASAAPICWLLSVKFDSRKVQSHRLSWKLSARMRAQRTIHGRTSHIFYPRTCLLKDMESFKQDVAAYSAQIVMGN